MYTNNEDQIEVEKVYRNEKVEYDVFHIQPNISDIMTKLGTIHKDEKKRRWIIRFNHSVYPKKERNELIRWESFSTETRREAVDVLVRLYCTQHNDQEKAVAASKFDVDDERLMRGVKYTRRVPQTIAVIYFGEYIGHVLYDIEKDAWQISNQYSNQIHLLINMLVIDYNKRFQVEIRDHHEGTQISTSTTGSQWWSQTINPHKAQKMIQALSEYLLTQAMGDQS